MKKVVVSAALATLLTMTATGAAFADTSATTSTTNQTSTQTDIFFSKQFDPAKLTNGNVLQANPYVVVTTPTGLNNDEGDYVYVLEYVGKGDTGTGEFVTYWKSAQVDKATGKLEEVVPTITNFPVDGYPDLKPPADSQGSDFGNSQPARPIWATGSGLNTNPIPNWNPTVKTPNLSGFKDVPDYSDYLSYIADLKAKGVVVGNGDGTFGPSAPLTRADFAVLVDKAFNLPAAKNTNHFTDTKTHWAKEWIEQAYEAGVVAGTSDTTFEPDAPLTREEAATMVWRVLKTNGVSASTNQITIDSNTSSWASEGVENIISYKIYGPDVKQFSDGSYEYDSSLTMNRESAAALIDLAMKQIGK